MEKTFSLRKTWWCSTYGCPRQTHFITALMCYWPQRRSHVPVGALKQYLAVQWMDIGLSLFCFQSGAFLSKDRLSSQLRLLHNMSLDSSSYFPQFCIGAASSASADGLPKHLIKRMGPLDLGLLQDVCEIGYTNVAVCGALLRRSKIIEINQQLFVLHLVHVSILLGASKS